MSLIDEALKRARLEAGKPDAASPVAPVRWFPAPAHAARRSRRTLLTGMLAGGLGMAVLAVVVVVVWMARARAVPANATVAARAPDAVAAAPSVPPTPLVSAKPSTPVEESLPGTPPVHSWEKARQASRDSALAPREPAAEPSAPPTAPPRRESRPLPAPPAVPPSTSAATPPASRAPAVETVLEDGKTYSRSVSLSDGIQLALSGIAYSETQPVAVLNGRVVGPGEIVAGFTVSHIALDRVELKGRGVTIVLLLN